MSRSLRDVYPMHRRPEKDLENPPAQIVNPIPGAKYLRDVIQRIEEQESLCKFCGRHTDLPCPTSRDAAGCSIWL